ncbi:MAG TPA: class I SAM-dependent methyltransferase, partial [Tepidisphaeraceae bacterium]|nr:class I SAM-dependent methyltransferase [Tepidisphaeraceae bacterium]
MSTISDGHPERLVPGEASGSLLDEHMDRYRYVKQFVAGKVVLDVACGAGYGAAMLKDSGASKVIGVDLSAHAIEYAKANWQRDGIDFRVDDAQRLESISDRSIDCVASFETLEHLPDANAFVKQLARVMKPGATLF